MILEYIRSTIPAQRAGELEADHEMAGHIPRADDHYDNFEVSRGIEERGDCTRRLEWNSVDRHERGSRPGTVFAAFFCAVLPFFSQINDMKHYETRDGGREA